MIEMKQENSMIKEDIITIWIGQLLIYSLKAERNDLLDLRLKFNQHLCTLLGTKNSSVHREQISSACGALCNLMGEKFSWCTEAQSLLCTKITNYCMAFASGNDFSSELENLKIVDAWSGLSSCLAEKTPMPLSLLDNVLEIVLPVLSHGLVEKLSKSIDGLILNHSTSSADITAAEKNLTKIVDRLCFGSPLNLSHMHELELAVLIHLPKEDNAFAAKTGFLYKLLQTQFIHEEEI